jgi:transcriptional regulator with XRE-family HTH domain
MGDDWIYRIDVKGLSDDDRREIVKRVKDKLGYSGALEALGIARGSLSNYLHGIRRVPDDVIRKALQYLDEPEFNRIVQGFDRLRAVGIVRDD